MIKFLSRVARLANNLAIYQGYPGNIRFLIAVMTRYFYLSNSHLNNTKYFWFGYRFAVTSIILFYRALNYLVVNNSIQSATEYSGSFLQIHKELKLQVQKQQNLRPNEM